MIVVTKEMNDEERTKVLNERVLSVPKWDEMKNPIFIDDPKRTLNAIFKNQVRELGLLGTKFTLEGLDQPAIFSAVTLKESISITHKRRGSFFDLAKLFTIADEVIPNAILVESQANRHVMDKYSKLVGVKHYLSAFHDDNILYPVKISASSWENSKTSTIKLTVTIDEIAFPEIKKKGLHPGEPKSNLENPASGRSPSYSISVSQLVSFFNEKQDILIKNLPDGMLTEEQKEIKKQVIKHDNEQEEKHKSVKTEPSEVLSVPVNEINIVRKRKGR